MAHILVMDDDETLRNVMTTILREQGHEVSAFATADDGLAAAGRGSFDLVVTDILMPGTTGYDAILELRQTLPATPVLAVSGGGDDTDNSYLDIARRLGARRALHKPFTADQFRAAVAELLEPTDAVQ